MKSVVSNGHIDTDVKFPCLVVYSNYYIVLVTGGHYKERHGSTFTDLRYKGILVGKLNDNIKDTEIGRYSDNWGNYTESHFKLYDGSVTISN